MGAPINLQELSYAITRLLGTQCTTPSPVPFASGSYHILYKASLVDGREVLARVRWMDEGLGPPPVPTWQTPSEAATMGFLRSHTTIPVPRVLAVDEDIYGLVGGPFMVMDIVPGQSLLEAAPSLKPESLITIFEELADYQIQLLHVKLTGIGSLHQSHRMPEKFYVGPLAPVTPLPNPNFAGLPARFGPWTRPKDWMEAHARRQICHPYTFAKEPHEAEMMDRLVHLIQNEPYVQLPTSSSLCLSGITHPDLDFHNIIVKVLDDGSCAGIAAIIDWDGAQVVPVWAAAKPISLHLTSAILAEHDFSPYLPAYYRRLARDKLYRDARWMGVKARRLLDYCADMPFEEDLIAIRDHPDKWTYPVEDEAFSP